MKKISDTDEEKKQLSYLGSMLRREPTEEENAKGSQLVCRARREGHTANTNRQDEDLMEEGAD
jgi:hypothetical protein